MNRYRRRQLGAYIVATLAVVRRVFSCEGLGLRSVCFVAARGKPEACFAAVDERPAPGDRLVAVCEGAAPDSP